MELHKDQVSKTMFTVMNRRSEVSKTMFTVMNRNANKYFLPSLHLLTNVSIVEYFVFHGQFFFNQFKIRVQG